MAFSNYIALVQRDQNFQTKSLQGRKIEGRRKRVPRLSVLIPLIFVVCFSDIMLPWTLLSPENHQQENSSLFAQYLNFQPSFFTSKFLLEVNTFSRIMSIFDHEGNPTTSYSRSCSVLEHMYLGRLSQTHSHQ